MLPIDPSTYSFDPLFLNALIGMFLSKVKASNHPAARWISDTTPIAARLLNAALATLTAAGMALSYTTADDGSLAVTVSGITTASVFTFLWTAGKNYFAQSVTSGGYDLWKQIEEFMKNHPTPPEVD